MIGPRLSSSSLTACVFACRTVNGRQGVLVLYTPEYDCTNDIRDGQAAAANVPHRDCDCDEDATKNPRSCAPLAPRTLSPVLQSTPLLTMHLVRIGEMRRVVCETAFRFSLLLRVE